MRCITGKRLTISFGLSVFYVTLFLHIYRKIMVVEHGFFFETFTKLH